MFGFKKKKGATPVYFCNECGRKKWLSCFIGNKFCLQCMKKTNSDIKASVFDNEAVRDSFKLRKKSLSFKKFAIEVLGGRFSSHRYKDGVEKSRTANKEKDKYDEVVKDYKTGKVVHETHEKLSEHRDHGSAKH
jgi:hypothetical protein